MNPFKRNKQILPSASINSVYVDDVPASQIFKSSVLKDIIDQNREALMIAPTVKKDDLLREFYNCMTSDDEMVKRTAKGLAVDFGDRLASVIVTLKKPTKKSKLNRKNWNDSHWDFWKSIKKLYILGGMTSPVLSKIFYDRIDYNLKQKGISDLQVVIQEDSRNSGTKGLSKITTDGEFLLFDFGQTYVKRRYVVKKQGDIVIDTVLPMTKSGYLMYKGINDQQLQIVANQLHNFISGTIYKSIKEVDFKGNVIHMAIANYVYDGVIFAARGGYGKLALISDNYAKKISHEISQLMGRDIDIKLHHDTSSMAYNFEKESSAAVLSVGTAFGIAFIDD